MLILCKYYDIIIMSQVNISIILIGKRKEGKMRGLKIKRKIVFAVTVGMLIVQVMQFLDPQMRDTIRFFGNSALIMLMSISIANIFLKEDILMAFDMPSVAFSTSPISVVFHMPCIIFGCTWFVLWLIEIIP